MSASLPPHTPDELLGLADRLSRTGRRRRLVLASILVAFAIAMVIVAVSLETLLRSENAEARLDSAAGRTSSTQRHAELP